MGHVIRLLITGAGAPGFAGIFSCLKEDPELEIWCCDSNSNASGKALCDNFFQVPKANDPLFSEELFHHCLKHKIQSIVPIVTQELEALAPVQKKFQNQGIIILMNNEEVLKNVNNKCTLYTALLGHQIEHPDFRVVTHLDQLKRFASDLGYPLQDIIMKPCLANGSRGFRKISTKYDALQLLFKEKPSAFPLSLNALSSILRQGDFPPFLLSEYLPGPEYSIDMICDNGNTLLCIPRLREQINNGISVAGVIEMNEEIIRYCTLIAGKMKLHGFNGIQVKKDSGGKYKILEINPRLQGTTAAVRLAGVNIPQLGIDYFVKGRNFFTNWKSTIQWNTSFFRVYKDFKLDKNG
jgi:carbamoyl-phosphate synthase large subunit